MKRGFSSDFFHLWSKQYWAKERKKKESKVKKIQKHPLSYYLNIIPLWTFWCYIAKRWFCISSFLKRHWITHIFHIIVYHKLVFNFLAPFKTSFSFSQYLLNAYAGRVLGTEAIKASMTGVDLTWSYHHEIYPHSLGWTWLFPSVNPGELVCLGSPGGTDWRIASGRPQLGGCFPVLGSPWMHAHKSSLLMLLLTVQVKTFNFTGELLFGFCFLFFFFTSSLTT